MILSKKITIFFAEYGVILLGIVFLIFCLEGVTIEEFCRRGFTGMFILFVTLGTAFFLKRIIHKKRPPRKEEFFIPSGRYAFPSGHATGLTAITLYIALSDGNLAVYALIVSLIVMVARVHARVHDAYDMFGGVVITSFVTLAILPLIEMYCVPHILQLLF